MAFGLSYMPNMGNTGAGWEKLGETIGQAFQQHGEAKGMAGKYRSLIKAQMGKDEQAQQFSDDFLGSDGTYVVDPDHLGLGELQEAMDAMAARRTDDGRNMIQSVVSKVKEAQETRNLRLNQLGDPQNDQDFKRLGDENTRYRERINAPNDPNLKREAEQLRGEINSRSQKAHRINPGMHIPPGTIADSNAAAQEERSFREKEMRLGGIEAALNQTPGDLRLVKEKLQQNTWRQQTISENYRNQREALANQPLNIPEIVMSSMGDHPWASSQSIQQALNLSGIMQQQQEMEATRPARRELQQAQVTSAKHGAISAGSRARTDVGTEKAAIESAKTAAAYSKASLDKLMDELESAKESFTTAELATIAEDGPKALAGMNKSKRSEAMKVIQLQVNVENKEVQKALMKLKQNAKPGISGTILTNSRILAENASKAMDDLRKDIRMAKAVKSSNPEMAKNLGYDIPQMEKDLKKWEKDLEKYKGILDQALGHGETVIQDGVKYKNVNGNWVEVK
jgi:hypothetical protein